MVYFLRKDSFEIKTKFEFQKLKESIKKDNQNWNIILN